LFNSGLHQSELHPDRDTLHAVRRRSQETNVTTAEPRILEQACQRW
jgi:hypothetical protein